MFTRVFSMQIQEWSDIDLAYLAGFVDGEGAVYISRHVARRKSGKEYVIYEPTFILANTNLVGLQRIQDKFGGRLYLHNNSHAKPHWKPMYHLRFRYEEMRQIFPKLIPFLVLKQEQARLTLSWLELRLPMRQRHRSEIDGRILPRPYLDNELELFEKIRKLNG